MATEPAPSFVRISGQAQTYNEVAFRYFLEIERKRAAQAVRPLILLLVKLNGKPEPRAAKSPRVFNRIFAALASCVREVDLVGWYREGVVAAAALAPTGPTTENVRQQVRTRVRHALNERLAPDEAARVSVRVVMLGRSVRN